LSDDEAYRTYNRKSQADRRARLEEQGLCVDCGKRPMAKSGGKCCETCKEKHRKWASLAYMRAKLRNVG